MGNAHDNEGHFIDNDGYDEYEDQAEVIENWLKRIDEDPLDVVQEVAADPEPEYQGAVEEEQYEDCWGEFQDIQLAHVNGDLYKINIEGIDGYYYTVNQLRLLRRYIDYALGPEGIAIDLNEEPF